ncbi:serine hydrolase domain-containing protein [Flagellimonas profundi]|uniref:Beta-lactamase family protein n=1 Tax=Flagellimonas profundi TaxID=2915620 RepID=A0ABS3FD38_9FLAO|nr:serine hydrolase domain-containing protein [Allomuricauda profundi]MBO0340958.1 beta-lactamase family protein [Allomuricauda profundi]
MKNWIVSGLLFLSCLAWSQEFDSVKLNQYFDLLEENDKFMGSVAVSKNGELVYTRSVGYCDMASETKATSNSRYRIGSISKTFTTVLVFKAVAAGKLALDQTLDDFFPEVPNAANITIEQMLGNRSGIHNITDDFVYMTYMTQPKTEDEMVEIIVKAGSDFEPDSKFQYSNSNFVLLTYILEKSTGKPYASLLQKYITEPLELTDTYVGGKIGAKDNECKSYMYLDSWQEQPETDMSIPVGAGAIVSNPTDIVKFGHALFGGDLLSMEYVEQMKNIQEGYGLGLFRFPFDGRTSYGHTGGIDGFSSIFGHFDDGDVTFAMTSNGANMVTNDIAIALLSTVYNEDFEMPEFNTYEVTPEQLEVYVGIYSAREFPLDITITVEKGVLKGRATGQPAFTLEAIDENEFEFIPAGINMTFDPEEHTMLFKQRGTTVKFTKE